MPSFAPTLNRFALANDDKPPGPPQEDFAAMFAESERSSPGRGRRDRAKPGDRVRGKIVSIGRQAVFVELEGGQGDGMLDPADLLGPDGAMTAAVGDSIDAVVVENAGIGRALVLRRGLGRGADGRADLAQAQAHGIPVEGTVTAANKGGVEVSVAGLRAFCPISQLDLRHVEDATVFVGQTLSFRVVRYEDDRRGPNIVLSRRVLLEEEARARAVETRARLTVGTVLSGVVTGLKDYGAFVDLGGLDGMLHVSEIGFQRVTRPADVLSIGQRISVQVIRIEKSNDPKRPEQVALSLKSLEVDPWEAAVLRFPEGSRARGTVTRVTPFGAFVELVPGVEGLLHISELAEGGGGGRPLRHARDALKPGVEVDVTVTSVDRERRRMSLALAAREEAPDPEARAAADRAAAPSSFGTLGDLLKGKPPQPKR
jgi:small subunit ribosomal protein S1